ncbi:MAG: cysteine--tRNA ligase [Candidatus Omnitrophica bacterium]|nr:cysteine--tRNA ligase [Candidatus Omnitrophota bacterium]
MPIFIYNSLTRKKEEFIPLKPKEVKMYVCGPTVYDQPHIGHARSAYIFDVIRRYLVYRGYQVKFVRNVTDVDDKIINKAQAEFENEDLNEAVRKVSTKYLGLYHEDMKSLGILEPDIEPKATEYVGSNNPLMQKFIQLLIEKGCAYVSEGDVYFDIKKAKDYGKLSHQALEKMEAGARIALGEKKKDPLDFALWKSAKPGEPAWDSPWGPGRPGWHIECSVMSSDILGDEFDIHGGGLDLIFPHHENEIAQSEGAGKKFARYWMHHGLLTINAQKMSKSLGNFITVKDFLDKYEYADLLKLLFLSTHYSHPVDYTDEKIQEAKQSLERILILQNKLVYPLVKESFGNLPVELGDVKGKFAKAMDDDFNTPRALATIFDLVNIANKNIDDQNFISHSWLILQELTSVFGLDLNKKTGFKDLQASVTVLIDQRNDARKRKDFKRSDEIRQELETKGIILEDTKEGTTWRRKL